MLLNQKVVVQPAPQNDDDILLNDVVTDVIETTYSYVGDQAVATEEVTKYRRGDAQTFLGGNWFTFF